MGKISRRQAGTTLTPACQRPLGHSLSSLCKVTPHTESPPRETGSPCYSAQLAWGLPECLPMSELQKASWGWLGEHVHASAPHCPRLQQPRSTTSPTQGVIVAAAVRCGDCCSSLESCRVLARILQSELTRQDCPCTLGNFELQESALQVARRDGLGRCCEVALGSWSTRPQSQRVASGRRIGNQCGEAGEEALWRWLLPAAHCAQSPGLQSDIGAQRQPSPSGARGPPPPTNGSAALPHRPSKRGRGRGARGDRAGPAGTVQILIGNNAVVGTRVGGLGASRASVRCSGAPRPHCPTPTGTPNAFDPNKSSLPATQPGSTIPSKGPR